MGTAPYPRARREEVTAKHWPAYVLRASHRVLRRERFFSDTSMAS